MPQQGTAASCVLVLCGLLSGDSLVVEQPADIAGTYPHVTATFGPQVGADGHSVSGNVTIPDPADACAEPTNDVQGSIVLANRGACDFIDKVRHAQAAGATAVVVANDQGEHLFKMYSSSDVSTPNVVTAVLYLPQK